jgi:hypothetical protein
MLSDFLVMELAGFTCMDAVFSAGDLAMPEF